MNRLEKIGNSKKVKAIIIAVCVILIVVGLVLTDFDTLKNYIQNHRVMGILVSVLLYGIFGIAFIPTEPLTVFLAALMGPLVVIILSTVGNTIACFVEYYIGSGVSDLSNFEKQKSKLPFNLGNMPVHSLIFQIFGRMIPGFGSKIVSIMSGIYKVSLVTFGWTSILSNLVGAVILSYGGDALARFI